MIIRNNDLLLEDIFTEDAVASETDNLAAGADKMAHEEDKKNNNMIEEALNKAYAEWKNCMTQLELKPGSSQEWPCVLITGQTGVGKTWIIKKWAEDHLFEYKMFQGSSADEAILGGVVAPSAFGDSSKVLGTNEFREMEKVVKVKSTDKEGKTIEHDKRFIIFVDEFNRTTKKNENTLLQLIADHEITYGQKDIPYYIAVVKGVDNGKGKIKNQYYVLDPDTENGWKRVAGRPNGIFNDQVQEIYGTFDEDGDFINDEGKYVDTYDLLSQQSHATAGGSATKQLKALAFAVCAQNPWYTSDSNIPAEIASRTRRFVVEYVIDNEMYLTYYKDEFSEYAKLAKKQGKVEDAQRFENLKVIATTLLGNPKFEFDGLDKEQAILAFTDPMLQGDALSKFSKNGQAFSVTDTENVPVLCPRTLSHAFNACDGTVDSFLEAFGRYCANPSIAYGGKDKVNKYEVVKSILQPVAQKLAAYGSQDYYSDRVAKDLLGTHSAADIANRMKGNLAGHKNFVDAQTKYNLFRDKDGNDISVADDDPGFDLDEE